MPKMNYEIRVEEQPLASATAPTYRYSPLIERSVTWPSGTKNATISQSTAVTLDQYNQRVIPDDFRVLFRGMTSLLIESVDSNDRRPLADLQAQSTPFDLAIRVSANGNDDNYFQFSFRVTAIRIVRSDILLDGTFVESSMAFSTILSGIIAAQTLSDTYFRGGKLTFSVISSDPGTLPFMIYGEFILQTSEFLVESKDDSFVVAEGDRKQIRVRYDARIVVGKVLAIQGKLFDVLAVSVEVQNRFMILTVQDRED